MTAYFISAIHFTSTLELDYHGSLHNFPNFRRFLLDPVSLSSKIIGYLKDQDDFNSLYNHFSQIPGGQLMCSSKENSFSSIFSILSSENPFFQPDEKWDYLLLHFDYSEIFPGTGLLNHLENLKNSIFLINSKNHQLFQRLEKEKKKLNDLQERANSLTDSNFQLLNELQSYKEKMNDLWKNCQELEKEEESFGVGLRCLLCENNLKNIVFLPCGHLVICEECLVQNLKTESNTTLEKRRKCLYCQKCKLKVKETRSVSFT
jgi:hypothetical protein